MSPPAFRRLVLTLGHGEAGPATLRDAAELARLLHLRLHCVLIEDEALFGLPALPFARELRLPTHEWRPLDTAGIAEDFAAMAEGLRRSLALLGTRLGIAQALEVQRGDPERCFDGLCAAGDIIVLAEDAARRPRPHPAARLHDAALRSPASVLLLPPLGRVPANAPVAVLLTGPDDPSLAIATGIAMASGTALLAVLAAGDPAELAPRAAALGLPPARLFIRQSAGRDLTAIDAALGAAPSRLLVLDHSAWGADADDLPEALARQRGAPVLIVETRAA